MAIEGSDWTPLDHLREDIIQAGIEVIHAQQAMALSLDHLMILSEEADYAFDDDDAQAMSLETAQRAGLIMEAPADAA